MSYRSAALAFERLLPNAGSRAKRESRIEPSAPPVGARVLLSGLQARADLNGTYGVVTVLDMTRLRAGVKIEVSEEQNQEQGQKQEQEHVMCKLCNLTEVAPAARGAKAKANATITGNNREAAGGGGGA